jgi:hypothetical protein
MIGLFSPTGHGPNRSVEQSSQLSLQVNIHNRIIVCISRKWCQTLAYSAFIKLGPESISMAQMSF